MPVFYPEEDALFSRLFVAIQSAPDVRATTISELVKVNFEHISEDIVPRQGEIEVERMTGHASQQEILPGRLTVGGSVQLGMHVVGIEPFLDQLMMGTTVVTQNVAQSLLASTAFADGVAFSITTQPTATSPIVNPCRLKFTLDTLGGQTAGNIVIAGTNYSDRAISETVTFTGISDPAEIFSTKYYKTVDASGITINGLTAGGNVTVDGDPSTYTKVFKPGNAVKSGMTLNLEKGTLPHVLWNMCPTQGEITFGETDALRYGTQLIGTHYLEEENLTGGTGPLDVTGWAEPGVMPKQIFSEASAAMSIDGIAFPLRSYGLTIDNRLVQSPISDGTQNPAFPRKPNFHTVAISTTAIYVSPNKSGVSDINFFAKHRLKKPVTITHLWVYESGPVFSLTISCPLTQFPQLIIPSVNTGQDITVDIPMRPLPSPTSPTGNDEITITLVNNAQDVSLTNYSPFVLS